MVRSDVPAWWQPVVAEFLRRLGFVSGGGSFSVSSFVRTRAHNAAVGGDPMSQHLLGTAADLVPDDGDMAGLEAWCRSLGVFGYVLNEGDHVHVQLFPAGTIPAWVYSWVGQ